MYDAVAIRACMDKDAQQAQVLGYGKSYNF